MKLISKTTNKSKIKYSKPLIEKIKVDNEISILMISPPTDPIGKVESDHSSINPFMISKV
jgi:hypothetical protein